MDKPDWLETTDFHTIDARKLEGFFLPQIIQKSKTLANGSGLKVVQSFEPIPLYGVMEKEGWRHFSEKISDEEFHIYFTRSEEKARESKRSVHTGRKIPVVIQSATPVVYPVILRMLQSPELKARLEVTELKIWQETEKHLGWIVSGKADISFSAVIASANLLGKENDVKLATVSVWDNFYMVTRGYRAQTFSDLKGKKIHMPLFHKAPPAQVTSYLMRRFGENPEDYRFVYGQPFGRPEEIAAQLINGEIDTALIREPEVSYALQAGKDIRIAFSYSELWKRLKPNSHGLPNAGLVFKGAFVRENPQLVQLFLEELDAAIAWVKQNREEAARLSYRAMGRSLAEIRLFLQRVNYTNIPAVDVQDELRDYLTILEEKVARKIIEKADELFLEKEFFVNAFAT